MIGIDSDICISILNGIITEKEFQARFQNEELYITSLTVFELYRGLYRLKYGKNSINPKKFGRKLNIIDQFVSSFKNLEYNSLAAKKSAEIYEKLRGKGEDIGIFDCEIASTFLANGINRILTLNVKHFKRIEDLEIIKWN